MGRRWRPGGFRQREPLETASTREEIGAKIHRGTASMQAVRANQVGGRPSSGRLHPPIPRRERCLLPKTHEGIGRKQIDLSVAVLSAAQANRCEITRSNEVPCTTTSKRKLLNTAGYFRVTKSVGKNPPKPLNNNEKYIVFE